MTLSLHEIIQRCLEIQASNNQGVWDDEHWFYNKLLMDWDQTIRWWNLCKPREVCEIDSQEVQDEGLCKNKYSSWV